MSKAERKVEAQDLPTGEQLVFSEDAILNRRRIEIPHPPQDLLDVQTRLAEKGISVFESHFLPDVTLEEDSKFPGWQVRPEAWFFRSIKEGKIPQDAKKLPGMWVLIDGSPKPNYDEGKQQYTNDPFAPILAQLREEGEIKVPNHVKHVPRTSRFGVSLDEVESHVVPAAAEILGVDKERIRVPKEIEFNVIGNLHHQEWGQTNTWEWLYDIFGGGGRLIGGDSGLGGLAGVRDGWPGDHGDGIGFRLLVEFPQK